MKNYLNQLKLQLLNRNPVVWLPILLLLTLLLLGLTFMRPQTKPEKEEVPQDQTSTPNPAKFKYPQERVDRLMELVDNRTPLSPQDLTIRNRLITTLSSTSGKLHETSRFVIEYVEAPDSFMVGVKTIDIAAVRQDAVKWFLDQGISETGICHLPLVFYPQIPLNVLPEKPLFFDPLPATC